MTTKKKTAPKKSAAKKAARVRVQRSVKKPKKSAKKEKQKAALVCADGAQCFWTTDGKVLSNLLELRDAFERMSDKVFTYHVTKDKNDFADWVEDVLGDRELGKALRRSRKPGAARSIVVRRLRVYEI